ncbi:MAG: ABC transporter permease [Vulcanisaeta sp.]
MPLYPRGLAVIALSIYLTAIALGLIVSTAIAMYYSPQLFLLSIGNLTIKKGGSISVFTSWIPISLAYSLRDMGIVAVPEVIVPSIMNGTPVIIRGIVPSYVNYYGINATQGELDEGALIGYELAEKFHIKVGDKLIITSFKGVTDNLTVTGIIKSIKYPQINYEVITNITIAQRLDSLPSPIVNVIYVNASPELINEVNNAYGLRVITHITNGSLAILDSMNHTVFNGPLMNMTLTLPFGAYYVIAYNESAITWFSMVMLRSNKTIDVMKIPVPRITNMTRATPSEWVIAEWPNGSLVSNYYLLIYYENGSLAYSTIGSSITPVSLPSGAYRFDVITGSVYYSVNEYVMPGLNVTVTLTPYSMFMSELTTYAYNYITKVLPLGMGSGPEALISALRIGIGTFIGVIIGLLVIMSIGLVGITEYSININRELITYLRLNRVSVLGMMTLIDMPVIITYLISTALGLITANYLWPFTVKAMGLSILNQPIYLITVSNYYPYVTVFIAISVLLIVMHLAIRFRVVGIE